MSKTPNHIIPLLVEEFSGIHRTNEPVTVGIPFPKAAVKNTAELIVLDPDGHQIPAQTQVLDVWNDQSLKWVLFDFQATVAAGTTGQYAIHLDAGRGTPPDFPEQSGIVVQEEAESITINTGTASFVIAKRVFKPFEQVIVDGVNMLDPSQCSVLLLDEAGREYEHRIRRIAVETQGPLRTTLKIEGALTSAFAEFFARIHFYANSSVSKIEYTIRNPRAAQHPGGLWDLGDEGSLYFNDLSFQFALAANGMTTVEWTTQPERPFTTSEAGKIEIYQDSSGGKNWNSPNHVNRFGKVAHSFCGYRVKGDELLEEGKRANPIVTLRDGQRQVTGAVRRFWQNFPKALEAQNNMLTIRLFPAQYQDVFELQGGEQKTHTLFLSFTASPEAPPSHSAQRDLTWMYEPLLPHTTPEWYVQSQAFDYLMTYADEQPSKVLDLIQTAVEGENTFYDRKEKIDEHGWRNFGDLYADHEAVYYKGDGPHISHYNNQYDCTYGMIVQFVRSGNLDWFMLMNDLVHHVIDIDIYHTDQDKPNYNGGLFWHTDHYSTAATATHRGYSKATMEAKGLSAYGGGHSNENNYTTGLMYHYYLTGEPASKEAVIGLADWIINMDDGTKTRFKWLNTRPTGFASNTASHDYSYHGPGRGSGYSVNALLDGYLLTKDTKYLAKAEQLIQRCIHPKDDIAARDLTNSEQRWSYTVFLQALGRYLDFKVKVNELDRMYCYARESLLHYATWMRDHEVCFSTIYDTLEYPTETWPAQDIRKSNVFAFAAKYSSEPLRSEFLRKAEFFFDKPLEDLLSFDTRTLTRPLILLMANGFMHSYFRQHPNEAAPGVECEHDFGSPRQFKPQLYYAYQMRTTLRRVLNAVRTTIGK